LSIFFFCSSLLENFRSELKGSGVKVYDSDDEDEGNDINVNGASMVDDIAVVAGGAAGSNTSSKKKSKANKSSSSSSGNDSLPASRLLKKYALESYSAILLLYTKHFLKDLYKLTNARCQDYAPSESTKVFEEALCFFLWDVLSCVCVCFCLLCFFFLCRHVCACVFDFFFFFLLGN
jgi:hypothetical protein